MFGTEMCVCAPMHIFSFLGGWLVGRGSVYAVPIAGYLKSDFRILRLPWREIQSSWLLKELSNRNCLNTFMDSDSIEIEKLIYSSVTIKPYSCRVMTSKEKVITGLFFRFAHTQFKHGNVWNRGTDLNWANQDQARSVATGLVRNVHGVRAGFS